MTARKDIWWSVGEEEIWKIDPECEIESTRDSSMSANAVEWHKGRQSAIERAREPV